jgi:hypothetical protein
MHKRAYFSALMFVVSCGSTELGNNPASRVAQAADLAAELQDENLSDPSLLPANGRAVYAGFGTLNLPIDGATRAYVGDLDLTVEFGRSGDQISGTLQRFDGLTGVLDIANGNLDRGADTDVDYTFGADITGTLSASSGDYVIDANLTGDIRGRNQDGITAIVFGDITGPDGFDIFDGTLAAARTD